MRVSTQESEAAAAAREYLQMVERIAETGDKSNVSVKLTQMGFDIDEDLCHANMTRDPREAERHDTFVRLDMESSAYTQRTLDFFHTRLFTATRR